LVVIITEKFGFEYWILPYFGYADLDGDGFAGLHSYQDSEISVSFDSQCQSTSLINKRQSKQKATIFPNPTAHKLTVYSPEKMIIGLDVYSTLGQHEYSLKNLSDDQVEINIWHLLPGPHFLKVLYENGLESQLIFVN
jgi:hypothetical protein